MSLGTNWFSQSEEQNRCACLTRLEAIASNLEAIVTTSIPDSSIHSLPFDRSPPCRILRGQSLAEPKRDHPQPASPNLILQTWIFDPFTQGQGSIVLRRTGKYCTPVTRICTKKLTPKRARKVLGSILKKQSGGNGNSRGRRSAASCHHQGRSSLWQVSSSPVRTKFTGDKSPFGANCKSHKRKIPRQFTCVYLVRSTNQLEATLMRDGVTMQSLVLCL